MHLGRLVAQGGLAELRAGGAPRIEVRTTHPAEARTVLNGLGMTDVNTHGETVTGLLGDVAAEAVAPALVHADVPLSGLRVLTADLEEMFVRLTGEGFDVSG
jgi:ABC-2 type transport system ATP-binding protein